MSWCAPKVLTNLTGKYVGERPVQGGGYFRTVQVATDKHKIAVIIPFYNEEWDQLESTLSSLLQCERFLPNYVFTYFLIQDGWEKAPKSMQSKLKLMFPHNTYWDELDNKQLDAGSHISYVFETVVDQRTSRTTIPGTNLQQYITLLVKKDNRKKHNSHEWFFSEHGFCGRMDAEFCLATDCSTLFAERCVERLVAVMNREEGCSVCTGRQVVMTAKQQKSKDSLIEWFYRAAQCYDFESSFASFMGGFAMFGFLPVIPGPCGLYRWSDLKGAPLNWYFEIVNRPNSECGLVLANLKIAEDRILSYSVVLKSIRYCTQHLYATFANSFKKEHNHVHCT